MKALLNRLNGICQFFIGIAFLFLMFQVSLQTFIVTLVLAAVAYPLYRLLLTLPLGSTIVFCLMAWIAYAVGQPLLASIAMFYVPLSLATDIVNFLGLFVRPDPASYAQSAQRSRIVTVE